MERFVLDRTVGLLGGNDERQKVVDCELLNDEDVAKCGYIQQQPNTARKESHCIIESDSSSDELEFYFGEEDEENEIINLLSDDSSETTNETESQLEQNESCTNLTANLVSSVTEPSKTMAIDEDIGMVVTEQDTVNLMSDDSVDDIDKETNNDNDESFLNEPCSVMMENKKMAATAKSSQEPTLEHDMDDDIQLIENLDEIINLISDDSYSDKSGKDLKKHRKIDSNNLNRLIDPIPKPTTGYSNFSCCVIDELVENGFNRMAEGSKMSDERRCEIIRRGRPFPNKNLFFPSYTESIFKIHKKDYTRFPWLTACLRQEQLFCWPCSLIYLEFKVFHPDLITRFGINLVLKHGGQPHHKFAERHYKIWQEELALNKTPKFDFCINSKINYDELQFVKINCNEVQQNQAATAKHNIVNHRSTGNKIQTKKQRMTITEKPKTTKEPQKKSAETTATAKPNVVDHRSVGNKRQTKTRETKKEQPKTMEELQKKIAERTAAEVIILFPQLDFLNIKRTASIRPSKTVIITDISKTCTKSQKGHEKIASEIASSIPAQPHHVEPYKQQEPSKAVQEALCLYSNTNEAHILDESLSRTLTKSCSSPNLLSLLELPQSTSSDTSHNLDWESHHKDKFTPPPNPHIFCSMGISGINNYYMNNAGIVSYVVVTDRLGKSAQFKGPAQNPGKAIKSDHVYSKSTEVPTPHKCIIEVDNHFSKGNWTHEQLVQILRNGGPCPEFFRHLGLQISDYNHMEKYGIMNDMIHEGKHWLVASKKNQRVVCWPCLLFGKLWDVRNTDIVTFKRITSPHKRSQSHRKCCLMYKAWVHENIKTEGKASFKVSRELLKCLIDVVCSALMRNNTTVTAGDIFALLHLVSYQDTKFSRELHGITKVGSEVESVGSEKLRPSDAEAVVSHFTKRIIESVFIRMHSRVILEVEHAKFVCLILSQSKNQPWVSVVARYVTREGDIVERFVKGIRAESIPSCFLLFIKVSDIIDELKCGKKLVGYTLDGAVIKLSEISQFDIMMTTKYLTPKLFHYRAHDLRTALLETISELTYIKVFCHHICELSRFFEHNEDVWMSLMSIDSGLGDRPCDLSPVLIVTINNHYPAFVLLFDEIISHPGNWPSETVVQALQFLEFFQHFHNRFFIAALSRILTSVEPFAESLNKGFDVVGVTKEASGAIISLNRAKLNFSRIFEFTKSTLVAHVVILEPDASEEHYSDIYQQVIRLALDFVNTKAGIIGQWYLSECQLYNVLQFPSTNRLCLDRYTRLNQNYIEFKMDLMIAQLSRVQQDDFFEPLKNDPMKMIQCLRKFDLVETMSEYYKFLELILTVPMVTTATSSNTRAVDRAVAYISTNESLSNTGWIWINNDLLSTMKQKYDFHANILSSNQLKNTEIIYRPRTAA